MNTKLIRNLILCALFFIVILCPKIVYADFGPKDRLIVHLKNPPSEPYYLDLLAHYNRKDYKEDKSEKDAKLEGLDQDMLKLLCSYEDEGWRPVLADKKGPPIWGELVGYKQGNEMIHDFGYVGVPKSYKIIIVTQSGKVSISDLHERQALQSSATYDYNSGKTTIPPVWFGYIIQYLSTYIPTLIIEGFILILFSFKLKENWKVFLLVNAVTQVVLTCTVGAMLIHDGSILAYLIQFPVELIILIAEAILYRKYFIGQSKGRRFAYGVVANLASWAAGFLTLGYQWELLMRFL